MSKHTIKYCQLIKVLRHERQHADMQKALRQQRLKLKLDNTHTHLSEKIIADIIDHDHSLEMDRKDQERTEVEGKLTMIQPDADRLWLMLSNKRTNSHSALPMQQKLYKMKEEARIDQILKQQQQKQQQITVRIKQLSVTLKTYCSQLEKLKQNLSQHKLQMDSCEVDMIKLKTDFDRQQKAINQRSNKFKQQKSKDIMIKNINREDDQMRNAMMSRIKLNQELDLGFTLQRRRAFNQAKQIIAEKNKRTTEKYNQIKTIYETKLQQEQALQLEKCNLQENNKQIDREIAYFLKQLIKHFEDHSKGIKWMIDKLLQLNQSITADLFPQNIYTQDKQFLQMIFKHTPKITPQAKKNQKRSSLFSSTPTNSIKNRPILFHNFKTEPEFIYQSQSNFNRTQSQGKLKGCSRRNKTTVHFDIDTGVQDTHEERKYPTASKKFNITSPSLKKIYQNTSEVISGLIRRKEWNYESCKSITRNKDEVKEEQDLGKTQIEHKLKQKFMQVRQHLRRNNLKKFIFGQSQ